MQSKAAIVLGLLVIMGIGSLAYFQNKGEKNYENTVASGAEFGLKNITFAEVSEHGSPESCWSIINGGVYDLTAWAEEHPGGAQGVLSLCGTDGSAAFNRQHGNSASAESALANFKIGNLVQ